jgi:hypothetical protein
MKLRIALWLVTLVVFTFGMTITGIHLSLVERVVGLALISVFYWVVAVKWVSF